MFFPAGIFMENLTTHGTEKSAFRWKYYEMHDMVQSKSFNGDSKVLHYMLEWKYSMHIGFYVQLP